MFDHLESTIVLNKLHEGMVRRHFVTDIIAKKIMDAGYWWLTLFKNAHDFCRSYDTC
jgi:hypothetical protein